MNTHVLVKLRSGEEIVATMVSKSSRGMLVKNPMLLKHIPFMDHATGSLKAVTIMEDWLARAELKEVTIPNSWIGFQMDPNKEMVDSYTLYLNKESEKAAEKAEPKNETTEEEAKKLEDEMTKILNDLVNDAKSMPPMDGFATFDLTKPQRDMVTINFDIPPNLFKELLEEGLLSEIMGMPPEDDEDMDDDEFFSENKKKKETPKKSSGSTLPWGNNFEDWSPDPRDYLK